MNQAVYELGRAQYLKATGYSDMKRDKDGFVILEPTADRVDTRVASLTTSIDDLESRLRERRAALAEAEKFQKSDAYKEEKKAGKKKKKKKERNALLSGIFNNADEQEEEREEAEEEDSSDGKSSKKKSKGKKENTLDTTYGKRFAPVVSMLHDTITDFDRIAAEIEEELNSPRGQMKTMYRSGQTGNLIQAKNSKLSAVKELGSIAKLISDLEYKKKKDEKSSNESDTSRMVARLGAKYLRGEFDDEDSHRKKSGKKDKKKGKKGKKKEREESNFSRSRREMGYDSDDDDEEESVKRVHRSDESDAELAKALAKSLMGRKGEYSFSAHERHLDIEGKYSFMVAVDPLNEKDWRFVAVDKKGRAIEGFEDEYRDLIPKRKQCRMRFDIDKKKCTDLNSGMSYRLIFTN